MKAAERHHLVVLESDWSSDGDEDRVDGEGRIGPDLDYSRTFAGAAALFDIDVDCAGFASESGFRALLRRFYGKKSAKVLVVGGHGSTQLLSTAADSFNVWKALEQEGRAARKDGLLLASCDLGKSKAGATRLLEKAVFKWVCGYRTSAYPLSSILIELRFWNTYFGGWRYLKSGLGKKKTVSLLDPFDPVASALLTYFEMAAAVGCRFDVRCLDREGTVVSSLEVFSELIKRERGYLDIQDGHLIGVKPSEASIRYAERYENLARRVWKNRWEWEVQS